MRVRLSSLTLHEVSPGEAGEGEKADCSVFAVTQHRLHIHVAIEVRNTVI
jgi:hypothetical protein